VAVLAGDCARTFATNAKANNAARRKTAPRLEEESTGRGKLENKRVFI